ncbi:MAG: thymidylate kinase, partial [Pseudomonadota bacterium]
DAAEEALLAFAARRAHWRATIAPALSDGRRVICDRFIDSTRVYQTDAAALVEALADAAAPPGGWTPDRTLVLDLAPAAAAPRRAARPDQNRFDRRGPDFHAQIRDRFRAVAAAEPERCRVIDAAPPAAAVAAAALAALSDLMDGA